MWSCIRHGHGCISNTVRCRCRRKSRMIAEFTAVVACPEPGGSGVLLPCPAVKLLCLHPATAGPRCNDCQNVDSHAEPPALLLYSELGQPPVMVHAIR